MDVTVLQDDKRYFPPYQCAVVMRETAEGKAPGLHAALEELSGKISEEKMRRLNYEVDVDHRPESKVASEFLDSNLARN
jgi:glycine betaine/choline ABC-type transport system substrate-binding protein